MYNLSVKVKKRNKKIMPKTDDSLIQSLTIYRLYYFNIACKILCHNLSSKFES